MKSVPDNEHAFVVYKWGDNPDEYQKYTGVLTALKHLKRGWHDNIHSLQSERSPGMGHNVFWLCEGKGNAERIVGCEKSLGIASKDWVLKEIEMQKEVLEKLIVIEKQFQKRR